ncbi:MAG: SpoIIE family protein phosphatase [Bacteroidetes bacterium]|nr:SpoIIE family protein phosphatase [Bacteroidota bacterium]HET6243936.1 two-component regulator propeller domain-containing protein [Bacteroidia bacterium]
MVLRYTLFQRISLLLFLLFILHFPILKAQQETRFKNISLLQGLSQSTVNCILEDQQGFIWIGTQDGLNRYDGYSFKLFKHSSANTNSLSENFIQSLYEDNEGIIWIGTYGGGLNSFNPVTEKFTHYLYDEKNTSSLSNNVVMSITQDKENFLWIGTVSGLNKLDGKTGKFERFHFSESDSLTISSDNIRTVFLDSKGRIWIGTKDNGFNLFNKNSHNFKRFTSNPKYSNNLSHNFVQTFSEDRDGKLWIGTSGGGINIFNPVDLSFIHLKKGEANTNSLKSNDVWTIFEDQKGVMWFGTYGCGLNSYDPKKKIFRQHINNPVENTSLGNNIVLCSYKDKKGLVWIGTLGGGLSYFDPIEASFAHYKNDPFNKNSLSENLIMSVLEDENENLWIGTYGGGLNYYNQAKDTYIHYKSNDNTYSISGNIIRAVFKDSENNLWIGTYNGGLSLWLNGKFKQYKNQVGNSSSISNNDIWCITEDKDQILWIGTLGGGLNRFDRKTETFTSYLNSVSQRTSLSNDKVISLLNDSKNNLWVGTNGGGLNLLEKGSGSFTVLRHNPNDSTSISNDRVRSIYEDKEGKLWIGTDGGGLNLMNPDYSFRHFTEDDGLPNNVIYGILEDDQDNLWLSTNNGLCRFNKHSFLVQNYDVSDGLQSNEFNQGAYFKGKSGKMYFGGINGLSVFSPSHLKKNNKGPKVLLTSIKLFGKEIATDTSQAFLTELTFAHDQNFLSFEFVALDFRAPEKNQYACKMEGFDKDWIMLGNKHFVSYTNLDPGTYFFRINASNNDDVWGETGKTIKITITPPFYLTKTFYSFIILSSILLLYLFIKWRTLKLRQTQRLLENIVRTRTQEVMNQKEIIEVKNKDITDSINYAKRIQQAILPPVDAFAKAFSQSFILYKPKDIVSGDFYWMEKTEAGTKNENIQETEDSNSEPVILVAVADCTGHGVPGAFLSIVGNNILNQAVNEHGISRPDLILNELNKNLSKTLQNQEDFSVKDGMDIALCSIDSKQKIVQFAGANNPLWIIKNRSNSSPLSEEFIEIKGDKKPIGSFVSEHNLLFSNHKIHLEQSDTLYIFSDGYVDQFGGDKGKKFKKSQLKALLLSIKSKTMDEQKIILEQTINDWQGSLEQVDDILVIGIRLG